MRYRGGHAELGLKSASMGDVAEPHARLRSAVSNREICGILWGEGGTETLWRQAVRSVTERGPYRIEFGKRHLKLFTALGFLRTSDGWRPGISKKKTALTE